MPHIAYDRRFCQPPLDLLLLFYPSRLFAVSVPTDRRRILLCDDVHLLLACFSSLSPFSFSLRLRKTHVVFKAGYYSVVRTRSALTAAAEELGSSSSVVSPPHKTYVHTYITSI